MTVKITADNIPDIGPVIRFHRKKAGLSMIELADIAGVGKTAVFDMEHGKSTVRLDTLFRVLSALNIAVLLDGPIMDRYEGEADAKS